MSRLTYAKGWHKRCDETGDTGRAVVFFQMTNAVSANSRNTEDCLAEVVPHERSSWTA